MASADGDASAGCTLTARKLEIIESKQANLAAMRKAISKLVRQCDAIASAGTCPIMHALATD